jgi:hypothetical protein
LAQVLPSYKESCVCSKTQSPDIRRHFLESGLQNWLLSSAKVKPPRAPSLLASGVTHTCPVAYALSSQIKRTGAPQQAPAEVAELLAAAVDTSVCPVVEATGGHLNFFGRQRGAQQADPGAISHPQSLPSASTDRASISQPYQASSNMPSFRWILTTLDGRQQFSQDRNPGISEFGKDAYKPFTEYDECPGASERERHEKISRQHEWLWRGGCCWEAPGGTNEEVVPCPGGVGVPTLP